MPRVFRPIGLLMALAVLLACNLSTPTAAPPPTADAGATAAQVAQLQTATAGAAQAQQTEAAASASTQSAAEAGTAAAASTSTQSAAATATSNAVETAGVATARARVDRMTATASAKVAAATQAASPLAAAVQKLVDDGYLDSAAGFYQPLPDFDESWAQLNWYQYWSSGVDVSNFVLQADLHWKSASKTADWWNSGCGFVFRADAKTDDHYLVYLGLDGYVNLEYSHASKLTNVSRKYYDKVDVPEGRAKMLIVAEGDQLKVFIGDQLVVKTVEKHLDKGDLAYTLISGTNKDFGTRCEINNVGLWSFK